MPVQPITVYNGEATCQAPSGELVRVRLRSHSRLDYRQYGSNLAQLKESLLQNLALGRLKDCWTIASKLNDADSWGQLAECSMDMLDIDMALRVYRQLGNAAHVLALQKISYIEDAKLLAGHVALLREDYSMAQDFFLGSTRPVTDHRAAAAGGHQHQHQHQHQPRGGGLSPPHLDARVQHARVAAAFLDNNLGHVVTPFDPGKSK